MLPIPSSANRARRRKASDPAPQLTKQTIIDVALEIIDRDGIEQFSMRSLAKALGVYPTSIYWHIPNRNALIGEIVGAALKDLAPKDVASDWKESLRRMFRSFRARIREHPGIAPVIGVQLASNASVDFDMIEGVLSALRTAGFADAALPDAYNSVIGAMAGFTTLEFSLVPADGHEEWSDGMRKTIQSVDRKSHPLTARLMPKLANKAFILRWENGTTVPLDGAFELFVDVFLTGLERRSSRQPE